MLDDDYDFFKVRYDISTILTIDEPWKSKWLKIYDCERYVDYIDPNCEIIYYDYSETTQFDISEWLYENCVGKWATSNNILPSGNIDRWRHAVNIHFENKEDAMRFKLTWS